MPHNENSRVKIPALVHFTRLGYKYISLRKYEGVIDDDTNILVDVLCDAINRINATSLTTTDVQKIVNALKAMLENDDLGREFYSVLINGYNGLKLIDFEDFGGTVNSYHVVTEMTCKNGSDEFRPDITPLINGIPLAFIEVKKPNNKGGIKAEYDRMLMRVKNKKFRRFINLTQIMVFSNNSEYDDTEAVPLEGAFYSTISYEKLFFSHFREEDEKLLTSVPEKDEAVENFILTDNNLSSIKYSPEYVTNSSPVSPTNRIITSLFSFERILTFLKYAIAYVERTDENGITHLEKHLMRYPQFFATKAIENKLNAGVKNGIIWHTQGSGKTALADGRVTFGSDGNGVPRRKQFLSEAKGIVPWTWWPQDEVGHTGESKDEVNALFGSDISFDTPKPERLIERIIHIASNPGDLVLDSFLGSGTTAAVAQKMGRRWIGVEMGNHAYTHCKVRMDKVIAGEDPGGITKAQNWQGGGGYRFYEVAPTLINKDSFDEYVINEDYDANMLAAAVALHEGFRYHPDGDLFWKQSVGNENSYLFVTTRHLNSPYLDSIKDTMEEGEYLIIACRSFDSGLDKAYDNITVKKIPQMLLERCEFGKADYNLNIVHPPVYDDCDEEEEDV